MDTLRNVAVSVVGDIETRESAVAPSITGHHKRTRKETDDNDNEMENIVVTETSTGDIANPRNQQRGQHDVHRPELHELLGQET